MVQRISAVIGSLAVALTMALTVGVSSAHADDARCYPPPCGPTAVTTVRPAADSGNTGLLTPALPRGQRTAAPFVAMGLLMVTTMLTVLCARRRAEMAGSSPAAAAATSGAGPQVRMPGVPDPSMGREPERSLR
jgi:hypothetical protein